MKTVSEWIKSNGISTSSLVEAAVAKTSDKAIAFACKKINDYGKEVSALCWMPKSKISAMENDFYTDKLGTTMYSVPKWLYSAKAAEGFLI